MTSHQLKKKKELLKDDLQKVKGQKDNRDKMNAHLILYLVIIPKLRPLLFRLLTILQWPQGNSCNWAHDIQL